MVSELRGRVALKLAAWLPEEGDAFLYGASALFASGTAEFSTISLYRVWGEMTIGPYLLAAVLSILIARRRKHESPASVVPGVQGRESRVDAGRLTWHWGAARAWIFLFVLLGALLLPLSIEVALRSEGNPTDHVQPEVVVIQQAAVRLAHGKDPYHAEVVHGREVSAVPGEPGYEAFFPYLPLMAVFGLPASTDAPPDLTDARIFFSLVTLLVVIGALAMCRAPSGTKVRTFQFLTVLPTAALPLATGGDDLPIVAFLLLAMVLAQRRRPAMSGLVLGIVSAMKFTAWPLAALALFAARDRNGKRAVGSMMLGMLVVAGPVVVPFILRDPRTFFANVVLFPLGLSGITSPAASPLPGHVLVTAFPPLHLVLPLSVALVGGVLFLRYLVQHPPTTVAKVTSLAGWVMLVAILVAPTTRTGYLLYPIDFFVWAYMFRTDDEQGLMRHDAVAASARA